MIRKGLFQLALNAYQIHGKYFLTFLTMGIGTTTVYVGTFSVLWYGFQINHLIAVTIAFICSATFQFCANRKVTFKIKDSRFTHQLFRYLVLLSINYLLALGIMQFAVKVLSAPSIGLVLTSGITPITGYLLFRYWVFRNLVPT